MGWWSGAGISLGRFAGYLTWHDGDQVPVGKRYAITRFVVRLVLPLVAILDGTPGDGMSPICVRRRSHLLLHSFPSLSSWTVLSALRCLESMHLLVYSLGSVAFGGAWLVVLLAYWSS